MIKDKSSKYLLLIFLIIGNTLFAFEKKNILVIHTYNSSIPWVRSFDDELKEIKDIDFFIEHMSVHKLKNIDESTLVKYLAKKYEKIKIDGIISESHESSLILQKYHDILFKGVPQFHLTSFLYQEQLPSNIKLAKINRTTAIKETAKLALKQNPDAREVYIIHDSSKASLLSKKTYENTIQANSNLTIKYMNDSNSVKEIANKLSILPQDTIVLYSLFFKDNQGVNFTPKGFLKKITKSSNVAIYSWVSDFINVGSLGGYMVNSKLFARNTVNKLLKYIKTNQLESNEIDAVEVFINYPILEKYNMTNRFIPPGVIVLNRPVSIWENYFKELILMTVVGTLLSILVIVLIVLNRKLKIETTHKIEQQNLLIQQSRMAEIGNMIGAITHQLKQPINTLSMANANLECKMIMDKENEIKEATQELIKTVNKQTEFMGDTVDNFQNFFKPKDHVDKFDPSKSANRVKDMFKGIFLRYGIDIEIVTTKSFEIQADENEIMQVFLNIFNNTKDAIRENNISNGKIVISFSKENNKGIILISDNAGGISEELLPYKIFDNYVSTKGEQGSGIGLNICKSIIEGKYHGNLTVQNIDNGACFRIEFLLSS